MQADTTTGEILEVWDWETARPTGKQVDRETAHRTGVPHEAVHLWIVRSTGGRREVLFQHRSPDKPIHPDCLDITVGGHAPYGFGGNKILKEAREEVGIEPDAKRLIDLGWCRYEEREGAIFQREFLHVFLLLDNRSLTRYRFNDGEVTGIYAVGFDDLLKIFAGEHSCEIRGFNGTERVRKTVSRRDFHPQLFDRSMARYREVFLSAAAELAGGGRVTTIMPDLQTPSCAGYPLERS